jgi:hypothetical protein
MSELVINPISRELVLFDLHSLRTFRHEFKVMELLVLRGEVNQILCRGFRCLHVTVKPAMGWVPCVFTQESGLYESIEVKATPDAEYYFKGFFPNARTGGYLW